MQNVGYKYFLNILWCVNTNHFLSQISDCIFSPSGVKFIRPGSIYGCTETLKGHSFESEGVLNTRLPPFAINPPSKHRYKHKHTSSPCSCLSCAFPRCSKRRGITPVGTGSNGQLWLTTSFWPSSPLNRRSAVQANSLSAAAWRALPYTISINNLSTSPVITRQKALIVTRSLFIRLWAISLG